MTDLNVTGNTWNWPSPHQTDQLEVELLKQALAEDDWSHTRLCEAFETEFARYLDVRYALLVPSGTAAIYLALKATGIEPGQEVIIPGITWPSVVSAVIATGAIPRTVDIDPDTLCMSAETVEPAISVRTFAVLATHLFGSQCDMQEMTNLTDRHGIHLIEDAAQAVGSVQGGRSAGSWGIAGAISLNDKKVLACGEGGCVITNSEQVYNELKMLQLILPSRVDVPRSLPGTFKVSEFQAAIALGQLRKLPARLTAMETAAGRLESALDSMPSAHIRPQRRPDSVTRQCYYNFTFHLELGGSQEVARKLAEQHRIPVSRPYVPLSQITDLHPAGRPLDAPARAALGARHRHCETAFEKRSLRLPHYVLMSEADTLDRVGGAILEAAQSSAEGCHD